MLTLFDAILIAIIALGIRVSMEHPDCLDYPEVVQVDTTKAVIRTDWDIMLDSLIMVESEGIDTAYNEISGASGCLQITDIYVAEVNRLLGEDRYCKDDAFDREKSLEMFEVYQSNKNPNRDIDKAIRLHNPKAGEWYLERVKNAMR